MLLRLYDWVTLKSNALLDILKERVPNKMVLTTDKEEPQRNNDVLSRNKAGRERGKREQGTRKLPPALWLNTPPEHFVARSSGSFASAHVRFVCFRSNYIDGEISIRRNGSLQLRSWTGCFLVHTCCCVDIRFRLRQSEKRQKGIIVFHILRVAQRQLFPSLLPFFQVTIHSTKKFKS